MELEDEDKLDQQNTEQNQEGNIYIHHIFTLTYVGMLYI